MITNATLLSFLGRKELRDLVSKYYQGDEQRYLAYENQLTARRFVVPIAGVQGSGKSTLLNAISFGTRVLPEDVSETTCVPIEIAWSQNPNSKATVHYFDGRTALIPYTEESLAEIVHNERNPGNKQQVERVVLESSCDLFEDGLVLVDLPGTGSLTTANMQTTLRYLKDAVGVIFMLRTVPPITRSESTFIALQWASLPTAFFVQNRWNDETDEEAQAGKEHNAKILQQIATQVRVPMVGEHSIHVIDCSAASRSALNQDVQLAESSGLIGLTETLRQFSQNWIVNLREGIKSALLRDLNGIDQQIEKQLIELTLDEDILRQRMAEDERRFERYLQDIDQRACAIRRDYQDFQLSQKQQLRSWANSKSGELRNLMRTKMRAGIVDGPRLAKALADEQAIATDDVFSRIQEDVLALQDKLRSDLEGLDVWNAVKPDAYFTVNKEESTKWENIADKVGGAVVGIGGMYGGIETGGYIGTLLGGPGIGTVIGGVIGGLLGGLAGRWLGGKARSSVSEQREKAVEGEVFSAIDRYIDNTSSVLKKSIDEFCSDIDCALKDWREGQVSKFESERERTRKDSQQNQVKKDQMILNLKNEKKLVRDIAGQLTELNA